VPDLTWGIPSSDVAPTQAAISELGAKWVRLEFRWYEGEPQKGSYSAATLRKWDDAVAAAQAAGARIVAMVHRAPGWASGASGTMSPPKDPADYADFMRFLVARYRGKVAAWEIWNEQNTSRFWPGGPDPVEYTRLLQAAYTAVKTTDPTSLVLFGGLAYSDYPFVERSYAAGAKGYFDAMAVHPYSLSRAPEEVWTAGGRIATNSFSGYREVRASMLARGDDKPIWFTEFGWSTTSASRGVSAEQQADYLRRALCFVERDPYVKVALWYNLRNNFWNDDADSWETQLGLMRTTFDRKPSYYAFRDYDPAACPRPAAPTTPAAGPPPPSPSTAAKRRTRVLMRVKRRPRRSRVALVSGRVRGAGPGQLELHLQRVGKTRGARNARPRGLRLRPDGSFRGRLRLRRPGLWRLRAVYAGSATAYGSRSHWHRFRV
jgi:Cellulase (glycosyl hydrolase family 5)